MDLALFEALVILFVFSLFYFPRKLGNGFQIKTFMKVTGTKIRFCWFSHENLTSSFCESRHTRAEGNTAFLPLWSVSRNRLYRFYHFIVIIFGEPNKKLEEPAVAPSGHRPFHSSLPCRWVNTAVVLSVRSIRMAKSGTKTHRFHYTSPNFGNANAMLTPHWMVIMQSHPSPMTDNR